MFTFSLSTLPSLQSLLEPLVIYAAEEPVSAFFQASLLFLGSISVYLLFYTLRDILIRSRSLPLQLVSIVLVAGLPIAGFFLYLLIRPAHTAAERKMMADITKLSEEVAALKKKQSTSFEHMREALEKKKGSVLQSFKKKKIPTT